MDVQLRPRTTPAPGGGRLGRPRVVRARRARLALGRASRSSTPTVPSGGAIVRARPSDTRRGGARCRGRAWPTNCGRARRGRRRPALRTETWWAVSATQASPPGSGEGDLEGVWYGLPPWAGGATGLLPSWRQGSPDDRPSLLDLIVACSMTRVAGRAAGLRRPCSWHRSKTRRTVQLYVRTVEAQIWSRCTRVLGFPRRASPMVELAARMPSRRWELRGRPRHGGLLVQDRHRRSRATA
jgi:hypothetical protein